MTIAFLFLNKYLKIDVHSKFTNNETQAFGYHKICLILASLFIVVASTDELYALSMNLGMGAGMEYSDNIRLAPANKEDELIGVGTIGLTLTEESGPVIADFRTGLRYENFTNNTFDDRVLFSFSGEAEWKVVPENLGLVVRDSFTQIPIDALDSPNPDNIQDTNVFSTGPDVTLRFGPLHRIDIDGRFTDVYFENSNADSIRYSVSTAWLYTPISTREISITVDAQQVDFEDDVLNSDFTREDYKIGLLTNYSRSEFLIEAGGTSIQRKNEDNSNNPLFGLTWTWSPTRVSTIDVSASSQETDTGRNLQTATSAQDQTILQTEQASRDTFQQNRVGVGYTRNGVNLRGSLQATWIERDYNLLPLDREIKGISAEIAYNLTARLVSSLSGDFFKTDEIDTDRINDDFFLNTALTYLLWRDLAIELSAGYLKRNGNLAEDDSDEIRASLSLVYRVDAIPRGSLFRSRN